MRSILFPLAHPSARAQRGHTRSFTFPETKGLTLEEISHVFGDGSDQVQQLRIDATMPEDGKLRAESDSDVARV